MEILSSVMVRQMLLLEVVLVVSESVVRLSLGFLFFELNEELLPVSSWPKALSLDLPGACASGLFSSGLFFGTFVAASSKYFLTPP